MDVEVTTYYLEITDLGQWRPKPAPGPEIAVARVDPPLPELNRFFYTAVGGDWFWVARLPWDYARWLEYLNRPGMETWVLSHAGVPAGYCEMETTSGGDAEIVNFGLLPRYVGRGLGGHLLTFAVERAWQLGARRVWLHTCSKDHPAALSHYQARGFRLYRTEVTIKGLPPEPPGQWPTVGRRVSEDG